ncbi:MAG: putative tryptophan/tyrosine transport system substrate-binding protein [Thiomicrorhabdus sp.]|nr:MAG: putative tryptophan/tyrosine transport system substrate-binding protein [Thiomicrorhabdus sp.]
MFNLSTIQKRLLSPFFLILILLLCAGCNKPEVPEDKFVVGIVNINSAVKPVVDGFKEKLAELSDMDDRVLEVIEPAVLTNLDLDKALLTLKEQGVDLVLTTGSSLTTKAVKLFEASDTVVIFAPIYDPIRSGLIDDPELRGQAEQGSKRFTGVKVGGSNLKSLALLKQAKPDLKKVFVPWSGLCMVEGFSLTDLQAAAEELGITLVASKIHSVLELRYQLNNLPEDIGSVWLLHSTFLTPNYQIFVDAAIQQKVLLASGTGLGHRGVMLSYGIDFKQTGYKAAYLANQVARGVSVEKLPVIESDFFFTINMASINAAQIVLPLELIQQADFIWRD